MSSAFSHKRQPKPMPGFVKGALAKAKLLDAYRARPEYQRDDYLDWISKGIGRPEQDKRVAQMLEELGKGDVYMGAAWEPPKKPA